jgi:hypothetical protein
VDKFSQILLEKVKEKGSVYISIVDIDMDLSDKSYLVSKRLYISDSYKYKNEIIKEISDCTNIKYIFIYNHGIFLYNSLMQVKESIIDYLWSMGDNSCFVYDRNFTLFSSSSFNKKYYNLIKTSHDINHLINDKYLSEFIGLMSKLFLIIVDAEKETDS